jgi:hypothetical protein
MLIYDLAFAYVKQNYWSFTKIADLQGLLQFASWNFDTLKIVFDSFKSKK